MIVIGKTSATKVRDGIYTALLSDLKINSNKVYIPFYERVDSYLEYTNINKDVLTRLKRVYHGSSDILTYNVSKNEIIGISFPDKSDIIAVHKSTSKQRNSKTPASKKANNSKPKKAIPSNLRAANTYKGENVNKQIEEKKDLIVLGPIIFSDNIEKRKRIHQISIKPNDIIFEDGFVLLEYNGNMHKYVFAESKEFYQRLNSKNKTSTIELRLKGGEIFNRRILLEYIEWLIVASSNDYKTVMTKFKVKYPGYQERTKLSSPITDLKIALREKTSNQRKQTVDEVEKIRNPNIPLESAEIQFDGISTKEDNDWNKIRFQKGMVHLNYSSKIYKFLCHNAKEEYNFIKSFYQTHHYNFTINLRNNIPVGVSIPGNLFEFLELGNLIHQMKKSRDMRDLWKVKRLTDGLANRAVEVLRFFNKDKSYYFTKLSEMHNEEFKIRVVWEPNIWSGSSYDIHLTFLFTYLHNGTYCLFWESTEISTATYIFKFTSLEKYNLGVEHFVSCISDINCYKGRMVLRRGNKHLEKVKFISHSSALSKGIDYDWNIQLKNAILN